MTITVIDKILFSSIQKKTPDHAGVFMIIKPDTNKVPDPTLRWQLLRNQLR
jgi:hypothetical protein